MIMAFQPIKFPSSVQDPLALTVALRLSNLHIFGLYWLLVLLTLFNIHLQPRTGWCFIVTVLGTIKTTHQQVGMSKLVGATHQYVEIRKLTTSMDQHFAPPNPEGGPRCRQRAQATMLRHPQLRSPPTLSPFPALFNRPNSFRVKPNFVEERTEVISLTSRSSLLPGGLCAEQAGQRPGSGAFFIILLQWKHTVLQLAGKREKEPEGAGIIKRMQWQLWQVLGRTGSTELN